jgi:hypothetical protein
VRSAAAAAAPPPPKRGAHEKEARPVFAGAVGSVGAHEYERP